MLSKAGATTVDESGSVRGQPDAALGREPYAIAAVVAGGTLLTGGRGGAAHTPVGVLLLAVVVMQESEVRMKSARRSSDFLFS